jgi:hypothetical protein
LRSDAIAAAGTLRGLGGAAGIGDLAPICNAQICRRSDVVSIFEMGAPVQSVLEIDPERGNF